ncbi:hypothetical protein [Nocardia salmonicida]|uniref:hypothetical protein n=2 Tax=Nocardiaceae TaxID=85025 RepID=UPI000701BDDD|nr:hypothetical protein [Nocardia salmonicida]KQY30752.1 hypothetical protein ASD42_24625 [Nocardia sp. Root136]
MNVSRACLATIMAMCSSAASLLLLAPAVASADSGTDIKNYGNGCVLDPGNRAATVDSLRFRCSVTQQDQIYRDAQAGAVANGVTNGWVTRPPQLGAAAPALWIGKVFRTGPDGGTLTNRVTGAGIEAFPADVYRAPSILDGAPTWALNYAPSPTPQVYDEIREVTPGVWFGYSWWREGEWPLLAAFVLTPA